MFEHTPGFNTSNIVRVRKKNPTSSYALRLLSTKRFDDVKQHFNKGRGGQQLGTIYGQGAVYFNIIFLFSIDSFLVALHIIFARSKKFKQKHESVNVN